MALARAGLTRVSEFLELMGELDRIDQQIRETRKACLLVIQKCMREEREPDPAEVAALRAITGKIPKVKEIEVNYDFLAHDVIEDFRAATKSNGA